MNEESIWLEDGQSKTISTSSDQYGGRVVQIVFVPHIVDNSTMMVEFD